MTYAITLLQRFGLFTPAADTTEAFEMRLTRITTRESRRDARAHVFIRESL